MASADSWIVDLNALDASSFGNEADRVRTREALYKALRKVQSPWDIIWEHNWVYGATHASVKTLIDMGVFKKWVETDGGPKSIRELTELIGADEQLIRRLMRHIAGQHLIIEIREDVFDRTPWAKALGDELQLNSIYGGCGINGPMFFNLPYFLRETGYRNPDNVKDCNWQHWRKSPLTLFETLAQSPAVNSDFHDTMRCHSKYSVEQWPKIYPTETIVAEAKPGRALVVDVGGSLGHDLEKFRQLHPEIADGSLILQDLPEVIKDVKVDKAIQVMEYDFFTPQPVMGARAYYMHHVLHDWPDEQAVNILSSVGRGMERGYSTLLVHESLITPIKANARVTTLDITMMASVASKERTEFEWHQLFNQGGFRIIKIWRPPQSFEAIIEAELA